MGIVGITKQNQNHESRICMSNIRKSCYSIPRSKWAIDINPGFNTAFDIWFVSEPNHNLLMFSYHFLSESMELNAAQIGWDFINQVGTLPPMRVKTYIPPELGWTSNNSPRSGRLPKCELILLNVIFVESFYSMSPFTRIRVSLPPQCRWISMSDGGLLWSTFVWVADIKHLI